MPWEIVKHRGKYVVVQKHNRKVVGTHYTRERAKRQLAALYANVKHR